MTGAKSHFKKITRALCGEQITGKKDTSYVTPRTMQVRGRHCGLDQGGGSQGHDEGAQVLVTVSK